MKSRVYLETTIVSYLTAEPTRDVVQAAHQHLTRQWWNRRERFDLFVSQTVLTEAGGGNAEAVRRRLAALEAPDPGSDRRGRGFGRAVPPRPSDAGEGSSRRTPRRDTYRQRHGLRASVELHAYRERGGSGQDRTDLPWGRV
jgi:hypothetical protein